ncbi:tol-pal system-associated acyl-CoA thioesterase [Thermomonas flagellata]|uniref:tol-pal system-associated acyl-CoA thioesterase n=1 Tax=Thermomonas flagellata TaxID=2888524 RepID=UPI001F03B645|nr:tol-pal system-associated acyl-CoA thioesterase [Thermomonas flagellata]
MAEPFRWPARVYWEDTDAGGVVYHARYLAFLERARSEWMRALGLGQEALRREHDLVFAVHAMDLRFHAPARLDDQLAVSVRLLECGGASLALAQQVERAGQALVAAGVRIAALRASSFRPCPIPRPLRALLQPLVETP